MARNGTCWAKKVAELILTKSKTEFVEHVQSNISTLKAYSDTVESIGSGTVDLKILDIGRLYEPLNFVDPAALREFYKAHNISKQIQLVHSLLNIEYNAVISYLTIPAVYPEVKELPFDFMHGLTEIIADESRHYLMLEKILKDKGYKFGDFPVNNNILKDLERVDSLMDHICLVSLTHEGKGIDAGPRLLKSLSYSLDKTLYDTIKIIVEEEERHVQFGVKWYKYLCNKHSLDLDEYYKTFMTKHGFKIFNANEAVRKKIGFTFY